MFKKLISAAVLILLCLGAAMAEEFRAAITKVDGDKVTFQKVKFDKDTKKVDKSDPATLPADGAKVVNGKFNKDTKKVEAGDAVEDGLKNKMFKEIGEKGVGATIKTSDDGKKITDIIITKFGKGKAKDTN
jgi:hypothetical protein